MKRTKGPWTFYNSPPYIGISGADDYCIHEVKYNSDVDTHIANAKLMASAPELLNALLYVKNIIDNHESWWMDCPNKGGFDLLIINNAIKNATDND